MLGPAGELEESANVVPPGRRLATPLNVCVLQGLSFVKARLLSMEIPAHVGDISNGSLDNDSADRLVKMDPYRGSWGLRFLELELSNPTDVVFEVGVSVQLENDENSSEFDYPKTRIDRDYSARVLIPLEHFKLPVLDGSFLANNSLSNGDGGKTSEKKKKAELNAYIRKLISKIKVRWVSGRNSSGELHIKDATQAALQTSIMDVLLPDPLTFSFRLVKDHQVNSGPPPKDVLAHDMTPMEVLVRNNTKDSISMNLSITCRDVAGENCIEGTNSSVLWSGKTHYVMFEFLLLSTGYHGSRTKPIRPGTETEVGEK